MNKVHSIKNIRTNTQVNITYKNSNYQVTITPGISSDEKIKNLLEKCKLNLEVLNIITNINNIQFGYYFILFTLDLCNYQYNL
jgi:hypothetical protein